MQTIKRAYSAAVQGVARTGGFDWLQRSAKSADAYGWRRWAASLLAIHDIQRMIELDLPWWNVAATREVADYLGTRSGARVFEYGAGASTVWLARRATEVVSVEHHPGWHEAITPLVGKYTNATVLRRELGGMDYVGAIADAGGPFDLIVIDGRRRVDCLGQAINHLKPGGIILFDDTGRSRYRAGIEACGLTCRHHFGRSYCVPYPDYSAVLYG